MDLLACLTCILKTPASFQLNWMGAVCDCNNDWNIVALSVDDAIIWSKIILHLLYNILVIT